MNLPFTTEEFLSVFKSYNESVFPAQIVFNLAAVFLLLLIIKRSTQSSHIIPIILSLFWLWTGIVYHLIFFTKINTAAYFFGTFFIMQGILFIIYKNRLSFIIKNTAFNYIGILLILYALLFYPLIGMLTGHAYPYSPTFGLPCPTTIFTFGIFLLAEKKIPLNILIIPFLWSLLGFSAAINLTIYEDTGLIAAGIIGIIFYFHQRKREKLHVNTA